MKTTKRKRSRLLQIISIILSVLSYSNLSALSTTWTGVVNTSWTGSGNWTVGVPGVNDTVVFNTSVANNPLLSGNTTIYRLVMQTDTFDLNGNTLVVTGSSTLSGGMITNGTLDGRGTSVTFSGSVVNVTVTVAATTIYFNGSVFNYPVTANITGSSTNTSNGGCTFKSTFSIFNSGGATINFANSSKDIYEGAVTLTDTLSGCINMAIYDTSVFKENIYVNAFSTSGGITFGSGAWGLAKLLSGKTISAGSLGFAGGTLVLGGFIQSGTTAQSITLTGSAVLSIINANFGGALTCSAPGVLLKTSAFAGAVIVTKTNSITNAWFGGNTFSGKFRLTNSSNGLIGLQTSTADVFNDSATFNAGSGTITGAKSGTSVLYSNLYTTGSNLDFSVGTGTYKFSGSASQVMKGSVNLAFSNLTIDKSSGTLTLQAPVLINTMLKLTKGVIITDTTNIITLSNGSSHSESSNASYVSGPMKKIGNSAFTFPVGKGGEYNPIIISTPSSSTDAFVAEYFNSGQALGDTMVDSLVYIYDCFYWKLKQTTGSTNVYVTPGWDTAYCMIYDTTYLRVTQWNGSRWADLGHGMLSGLISGTLTSAIAATQNYYITFGLNHQLIIPTLSLLKSRTIDNFYGLNCRDIFRNKCHDWQFADDCDDPTDVPALIQKVQGLQPGILRFNAGNPGNYFNWHKGWFFSDAHLYQYNQFLRDECHSFDINGVLFEPPFDATDYTTYDVRLEQFKKALDYTGAVPLFQINISVSDIDFQISLLLAARRLNIPVSIVEFGAELYLPGTEGENVLTFPTGKEYGQKCYEWTRRIKDALGEDVKVSVCGARDDNVDLRRKNWNKLMIEEFIAAEDDNPGEPGPDAITLHQYIHQVAAPPANGALHYPFTSFDDMLCKPFREITATSNGIKTISEMEMEDIRIQYPGRYEFWITEYGLDERDWLVHGTWAAGLFTAAQTLAYLEIDDVTMATQFTLWASQIWGDIFTDNTAFLEPEDGDDDSRHPYLFDDPNNYTPAVPDQYSALGHAMKHIGKAFKDSKYARKINFSALGTFPSIVLCQPTIGDPPMKFDIPGLYGYYFSDETSPSVSTGKQLVLMNLTGNNYSLSGINTIQPGDWTHYDITYPEDNNPGNFVFGFNGTGCMNFITNPNAPPAYIIDDVAPLIDLTAEAIDNINDIEFPPYSIIRFYNCSIPPLTLTASAENICEGQTVTLNLQTHPESTWQYTWSEAATTETYNIVTPEHGTTQFPCDISTTVYTVTVSDNTCGSSISRSASVSVNVRPAVGVIATAGSTSCPGIPVTLTANPTVDEYCNVTATTYEWINSEEDGVGNSVSFDVSPQTTTTYTVYALYTFESPDMQCAASDEVTQDVVPLPGLPEDTIICNGDLVDINLTQYDGLNCTFEWTDGTTNTYGDNPHFQQAEAYTANTPGVINLIVYSDSPLPSCTLTATMNVYPSACCAGGDLTIDATFNSIDPNTNEPYLAAALSGAAVWHPTNRQLEIDMTGLGITVNGKWSPDFSVHLVNGELGMSEGALIDMKPWFVLNLEGCKLHACTTNLWRGVFLHPAAGIITNFAQPGSVQPGIADAEYAITATNLSRVNLYQGEFDKNYVSLYMPPPTQFASNFILLKAQHASFTCVGCTTTPGTGLLAEYTGQSTTTLDRHPYAGMLLNKWAGVIGVEDANNPNVFDNLNNGIVGMSSAFEVLKSKFSDIQPYEPYSLLPGLNGTAILGYGDNKGLYSMTVKGLGKTNNTPTFTNCKYGVIGLRTLMNIYENKMTDVQIGIYALNNNYRLNYISRNNINCSLFGIRSAFNDYSQVLRINDNKITLNPGSGSNYTAAILIDENGFLSNNKNTFIRDNDPITITTGLNGIVLNNTFTSIVSGNAITLAGNNHTVSGIRLNTCRRAVIADNSVTGSAASGNDQRAFNVYSTILSQLHRNTMDNTEIGMYYSQPCNDTWMTCNEMQDHDIGDLVDDGGFFGHLHVLSLNTWTGSYGYKGFDYSLGLNPNDNLFFYNIGDANTVPPSLLPNGFFQITTDEAIGDCDGNLGPISLSPVFNDFDYEIATHALERENFEDEYNYIAKSNLYYKASLYPDSILPESAIDSFYEANENTTIGLFRSLDIVGEGLFSLDSALQATVYFNDSLLDYLLSCIVFNDSILFDSIPESDSLDIVNQNINLKSSLYQILESGYQLMAIFDSLHMLYSDSILALNSAISVSNIIEENQKNINNIYYSTISRGIYEFDSAQTATLFDIATQCPASGGKPVQVAQAIYRLIVDTITFENDTNCGAASPRFAEKNSETGTNSFVFPNPSSNSATLKFTLPEDQEVLFVIYDLLSEEKTCYRFQSDKYQFEFSCYGLNPGLYFYKIFIGSNQVSFGKFTIIK